MRPGHPIHGTSRRARRLAGTRSRPSPDFGLKADYVFVPFEKPVQARCVKFLIEAQPGWGFQLTELHVWDSLQARPWTPRLAHDPCKP